MHCDRFLDSWIRASGTSRQVPNMDMDGVTQTLARADEQHPWLEYSVWHDQEWVRIYTPGQPQLWHPDDTIPALPDNSFREWKRVNDHDDGADGAWTIRDWQHQGHQRILSKSESFSTHHAPDPVPADVQHPDFIQVEEMFTYAPSPFSDSDRPTCLLRRHKTCSTWRSFVPVF